MQRLLQSKFTLVALALVVFWLGSSAWSVYKQQHQATQQVTDLQAKISTAEKENQQLEQSADYAKSVAYLERQAREKLNYKAADEQVVFIYDRTASGQFQGSEEYHGLGKVTHWLYNFFNNKKD